MDPRTTLIVVTIMILLNGGVLGLMHRDLSKDVQAAAQDWRIGTLLAAGGCVLLAAQDGLPLGFILPIGNGCFFASMALYLRAVQRFDNAPTNRWLFLPVAFCVAGIYWASAVAPSLAMRAIIASAGWLFYLSLIAKSLIQGRRRDAATLNQTHWGGQYAGVAKYPISRYVLIAMVLIVALCMLIRALYFALHPHHATSLLISGQWINTATMMFPGALPIVGTMVFITMCSERLRARWMEAATTDYLTGLPNRRTINDIAATRIALGQKSKALLVLALIDIDHFKNINDVYGHDVGDEALKHIASTLKTQCALAAGNSIVARQGGEEFLCLLTSGDGGNDGDMAALAEHLRHAVEAAAFTHQNENIRITISIGVASTRADETQITHALKRADQALYLAKASGRNRVEISK